MKITLRIEDGKVRDGLRNVANALPDITAENMLGAMILARDNASTWTGGASYSTPAPAGSAYRRTGIYGGAMKVQRIGLSVSISNDARSPRTGKLYPQFVGGRADGTGQARVHAGRWPVIRQEVDKQVEPLVQKIDDDLQRKVRREGL